MRDRNVQRLSRFHTLLYRLSRGVLGRRLVDNDMLLLTTIGAKTARRHTVPLLYLRDDAALVVVASYGGRDHHPDWYHNLAAHPRASVQLRGDRHEVRARTATSDERGRLWPTVVQAYHGYAVYQERTRRQIPLVLLEPLDVDEGK